MTLIQDELKISKIKVLLSITLLEKSKSWRESEILCRRYSLSYVSKDIFNRSQEIMKRRERVIRNDDRSIEASKSKFNSKYILSNLLVCGDCGSAHRRRMERGKVL